MSRLGLRIWAARQLRALQRALRERACRADHLDDDPHGRFF
jgi:hypothetical protein